MTLQQLRYAIEVYRAGSINRAAQKLYVAQPNLSNIIKGLENEIGITLFQRTARGMEPTHSGEQFIRKAIELTAQFDAFEKMYQDAESTSLSLSVTVARSSEFSNCISSYFDIFSNQNTPYRIRFREATNSEVIDDLTNGNADLGIICPNSMTFDYYFQTARNRGLKVVQLNPKKYGLLFSKDHPLAGEKNISLQMLEPYIEVVHADYDMPLYPTSDYNFQDTPIEIESKKRVIFIYERGTLMEVLSNVKGSYIWSTTTSSRLKDAYGLIERECESPLIEGMDAIIYNCATPLSPNLSDLICTIQNYDSMLSQTKRFI